MDYGVEGPWIEFARNGQATGEGDCNDFGATYNYSDGILTIEEVFVTTSQCIGSAGGFEGTIIAISGSEIQVDINAEGQMVWDIPGGQLTFSSA